MSALRLSARRSEIKKTLTMSTRQIQKSCMPEIIFPKKEFQIYDFGPGFWGTALGCFRQFFVVGQPWWLIFLLSNSPPLFPTHHHHHKASYGPDCNIWNSKSDSSNRLKFTPFSKFYSKIWVDFCLSTRKLFFPEVSF